MVLQAAAQCQHIADYYLSCWDQRKCIGFNILRHGYRAWANGGVTNPANNLYEPIPLLDTAQVIDHGNGHSSLQL